MALLGKFIEAFQKMAWGSGEGAMFPIRLFRLLQHVLRVGFVSCTFLMGLY